MSRVVFPAPDAPISATSSPDFTYPLAARRSFERHDNVETIDKITVLDDGLDIPGGLLGPAAALLEASAAAVPERRLHRHVLPREGDPLVVLGHGGRAARPLADGDLGLQGDLIVDFPLLEIIHSGGSQDNIQY